MLYLGAGDRARVALAWALVIGVPLAVVATLWANLDRTFWFNEQWRAYYISKSHGWWAALRVDGAPFPAGWYFLERASSALFGSTELTLRLPTVLFLPVTAVLAYLLARRWLPLAASVAVSLVAALPGTLLVFAVQLSEYQIDAAAALAVLLLHDVAADRPTRGRLAACYGGMALACIFATPALFVAAPVLALDVVRALRSPLHRSRAAAAVVSGLVILAHLGLFVIRQNNLRKSDYWDAQFLPHHGLGRQLSFVWHGTEGFVTHAFTAEIIHSLPVIVPVRWAWLLSVCFAVLLVLGVVELSRTERGRTVVAGVLGSLALTLLASYLRYWPFGFVRTNYYLAPVLVVVAAVGAAGTLRRCLQPGTGRRHARGAHAREAHARQAHVRPVPFGRSAAAGLVVLTLGVGTVLAVAYEASSYRQIRSSASAPAYGGHIGQAVAEVRAAAPPGSAVVVAGYMATDGWRYYQDEYTGHSTATGPRPAPGHVLYQPFHGSPAITAMVRALRPPRVYLYVPVGATGGQVGSDERAIQAGAHCRTVGQNGIPFSGLLIVLACG